MKYPTLQTLTVLSCLFLISSVSHAELNFVQSVVDGDTVQLITGEQLKLSGIKTTQNDDNPVLAGKSADFLRGLVSGRLIQIEYDEQKTDADGNLLGYVWFEYEFSQPFEIFEFPENYVVHIRDDQEGYPGFFVFLNATMVKSGFSVPHNMQPNEKHAALFQQLLAERKQQPIITLNDQLTQGLRTVLKGNKTR